MKTLSRLFVVVAVFGLLGPPIGFVVFLAGISASQGFQSGPINWSDFGYAVIELGLPAAVAGAAFCCAAYAWPRRFNDLSQMRNRAALAALTMSLVFGIPFGRSFLCTVISQQPGHSSPWSLVLPV
ncbi:hypothetical protein J2X16_000281 [Pelomonas aquatica]|uniref:Uncharacterized protein n=1 Tax=Pelomonas aquatica TaxID=431058 RepID=A0ABU1Z4K1_9BURK|nr:hypothetical protein [Pelomonas aquatica]MDR7294960.1 hypothetical protein [Pelomonas aquatica]